MGSRNRFSLSSADQTDEMSARLSWNLMSPSKTLMSETADALLRVLLVGTSYLL